MTLMSTDLYTLRVLIFDNINLVSLYMEGKYYYYYRVAQLAEHWASIPKVVGSNPTVARHIFQACPVWIYTQSSNYIHLIHLST